MDFYLFLPALCAFFLTCFFCLIILKLFPAIGLMDNPKKFGFKRKPIPYSGGVAIFLSFIIILLIFFDLTQKNFIVLILGSLLIFLTGFLDDLKNLSPIKRLFIQFLSALILIAGGIGITTVTNPLGGVLNLDTWKIPIDLFGNSFSISVISDLFTIFWVIFCINAMNFFDGVSGLSSGIGAISGFTLLALYFIRPELFFDPNQVDFAKLSGVFMACSLAFLIFDFHPPKILMGDSGSTLLGFILATLSIISGAKIATALLVFGIPIMDVLFVVLRRIKQGQSPFRGDFWHFHHKLLKFGLSRKKSLILLYLISILFGLAGVFLSSFGKMISIFILFVFLAVFGFILSKNIKES